MLSAQATPVISTERGDGRCSGSAMDNFGAPATKAQASFSSPSRTSFAALPRANELKLRADRLESPGNFGNLRGLLALRGGELVGQRGRRFERLQIVRRGPQLHHMLSRRRVSVRKTPFRILLLRCSSTDMAFPRLFGAWAAARMGNCATVLARELPRWSIPRKELARSSYHDFAG